MRFIFKTTYDQDIRLFRHDGQKFWYGLLMLALLAAPFWASEYALAQLSLVLVYGIVGVGLMLLAGYTGLISLGHAAFMAVGAYTEAYLAARGWPLPLSLPMAALLSGAAGVIVGLPALRVKGVYLTIATLSFGFIVEEVMARAESLTGGNAGKSVGPANVFGWSADSEAGFYYVALVVTVLVTLGVLNLLRGPTGRAFVAMRDSEVSAQCMGINLARFKTTSFALSAAITGIAGALYAHKLRFISPDQFTFIQSVELLMMVVIGGIGSLQGAFFGAIFLIVLPQGINAVKDWLPAGVGQATGLQPTVFGLILIAIILFEPLGIHGRWLKVRTWFAVFPLYRRGMFRRQKSFQKSERLK